MASSVLRRVLQSGFYRSAAVINVSRSRCCQNYARCGNSRCCSNLGGDRRMSSTGSPWLMLPPAFEGSSGIVYKFYSLVEKKVVGSITKRSHSQAQSESESESETQLPGDDAEFVGSSHGWIALFDRDRNELFIANPLTRRHIKLPPLFTLPDRDLNAKRGRRNVSKVILSSSPDEDEESLAMMTFGPTNRLAFCRTGDGSDGVWHVLGNQHIDHYKPLKLENGETVFGDTARFTEDMVYCKGTKVLIAIRPCEFDQILKLDVWDPWKSPSNARWHDVSSFSVFGKEDDNLDRLVGCHDVSISIFGKEDGDNNNNKTLDWLKRNNGSLQEQCIQIAHIVYAEESDRVYIAIRFVMLIGSDGVPVRRVPFCRFGGLDGYFSSKTVGFVILKLSDGDSGGGVDSEIVDDLDGLAMFVGTNHSFAIRASDYPHLKSDSIYFTDSKRIKRISGRNDIGIFDYGNKTLTETEVNGLSKSSPMWYI